MSTNGIIARIQRFFRRPPYCVAIDFGTTKTSVAYRENSPNGKIEMLAFPKGEFDDEPQAFFPSVVAFEKPQSNMSSTEILRPIVGDILVRRQLHLYRDPKSEIEYGLFPRAKLSLGKGLFDPLDYPAELIDRYKQVRPEHVAALVLAYAKQQFEQTKKDAQVSLSSVTITIPASWDPEQRRATKLAGLLAGFDEVYLLEEPVAALLHVIDLNEFKHHPGNVLVVDFGGGTCDVALVNVDGQRIQLLGTGAENRLGGELIDNILFDKFQASILAEYGIDISPEPTVAPSVRSQLEEFKRNLNSEYKKAKRDATINAVGKPPVTDYSAQITVGGKYGHIGNKLFKLAFSEFVNLINTPRTELDPTREGINLRTIRESFEKLVNDTLFFLPNGQTIHRVYLVGGSSHLFFVKESLREIFAAKEIKNVDISEPLHREEAIAKGAVDFEYNRLLNNRLFISKASYGVEIPALPANYLVLEQGAELKEQILEKNERFKLRLQQVLKSKDPLVLQYVREGPMVGNQSIRKELTHDDPLEPDQEIHLWIQITADGLLTLRGNVVDTQKELHCKENYPVTDTEGLDVWKKRLGSLYPSKFEYQPKEKK